VIRRDGERMVLSGAVTLANVAQVLEEGRRHVDEGVRTVDLGEVTELDSALLALLLVWLREARGRGQPLEFARLPASLRTIAGLYGVDELIPIAS
jgi:phospholipid transport system transporter-binding protein